MNEWRTNGKRAKNKWSEELGVKQLPGQSIVWIKASCGPKHSVVRDKSNMVTGWRGDVQGRSMHAQGTACTQQGGLVGGRGGRIYTKVLLGGEGEDGITSMEGEDDAGDGIDESAGENR